MEDAVGVPDRKSTLVVLFLCLYDYKVKQKGHHYITESYQRNFSDEKGHVWILNAEKKIYNTNPENSFKESHFYTVTLPEGGGSLAVEKTLAEIEGGFINVLHNKIEKQEALDDADKAYVALFVAAMITRTKVQRNHFRNQVDNIIKRMEEMQDAMRKNPPKNPFPYEKGDGPSFTLEDMKQHRDEFDSDESLSTLSLLQDTAPLIAQMKWSVLIAPEGEFFISSDNPFCMCSPEREKLYGRRAIGASAGLLDGDIEVTFPLSKKFALLASWNNELPAYIEVPAETVRQINVRTSRTASSLIAHDEIILKNLLKKIAENENAK